MFQAPDPLTYLFSWVPSRFLRMLAFWDECRDFSSLPKLVKMMLVLALAACLKGALSHAHTSYPQKWSFPPLITQPQPQGHVVYRVELELALHLLIPAGDASCTSHLHFRVPLGHTDAEGLWGAHSGPGDRFLSSIASGKGCDVSHIKPPGEVPYTQCTLSGTHTNSTNQLASPPRAWEHLNQHSQILAITPQSCL